MNYSLLSKIQKSLILFTSVFSLSLFAAEDSKKWTQVSLSEEDALGANTLLALVRNINDFSAFLNGKALNANTQIMVRYPKNQGKPAVSQVLETYTDEVTGKIAVDEKGEPIKTLVTSTEQISELRYIIIERDQKDPSVLTRLAILKEEIISKAKTRKEVLEDVVVAEDEEKPTRTIVMSSSVSYNYLPFEVDASNLESKSSKMYKDAAAKLWAADAPTSIVGPGESTLYRVSDAATTLIVAASRKATALSTLINKAVESNTVELDTTSRKFVTYDRSATGAVQNVLLMGFVKAPNDKLVAPDAISSLAVKIYSDDQGKTLAEIVDLQPEENKKENEATKAKAFETDAVKFE